jgi:16S rRNA (guanine527-N7)-methyltransferase
VGGHVVNPLSSIYNLQPMEPVRIYELLRPFLEPHIGIHPTLLSRGTAEIPASLSPLQLWTISTYIDILLRWNARINLTAVRQPEEIVTRHFGESLFAARCLFPGNARAEPRLGPDRPARSSAEASDRRPRAADLIDLGSGAGFPGLPIKIWAPGLRVTLVESNQKKAVFLREVVRALTLTDIDVVGGRAEDLTQRAQLVTLRAVERFDSALPVAAGLVAPGGTLALLIGQAQVDRTRRLLPAFAWLDPVPIPLSSARVVLAGFAP